MYGMGGRRRRREKEVEGARHRRETGFGDEALETNDGAIPELTIEEMFGLLVRDDKASSAGPELYVTAVSEKWHFGSRVNLKIPHPGGARWSFQDLCSLMSYGLD